MAGGTRQGAQVAVQFERREEWVRLRVEGVDVLRDHAAHEAHVGEGADGMVGGVGAGFVQVRPAEETACPVALARLVAGEELVVVDGAVGLVQAVGAGHAAVVGQPGGDADAGAGEEGGCVWVGGGGGKGGGWWGGEESREGCYCACECIRISGEDGRCW